MHVYMARVALAHFSNLKALLFTCISEDKAGVKYSKNQTGKEEIPKKKKKEKETLLILHMSHECLIHTFHP